jgi:hypothetical protein
MEHGVICLEDMSRIGSYKKVVQWLIRKKYLGINKGMKEGGVCCSIEVVIQDTRSKHSD